MLSRDVVDSLFPPDLPEPDHWENLYPPRDLPEEAKVTRFSPSPTGFLHIGGVYAATIDVDVARQSGGVYLVRLEDTDQARVAEGAAASSPRPSRTSPSARTRTTRPATTGRTPSPRGGRST
jgi:glutamyl-tRNA synthetase